MHHIAPACRRQLLAQFGAAHNRPERHQVVRAPVALGACRRGSKRRSQHASRFRGHVRFSFGPSMETLETALGRLETLIAEAAARA